MSKGIQDPSSRLQTLFNDIKSKTGTATNAPTDEQSVEHPQKDSLGMNEAVSMGAPKEVLNSIEHTHSIKMEMRILEALGTLPEIRIVINGDSIRAAFRN